MSAHYKQVPRTYVTIREFDGKPLIHTFTSARQSDMDDAEIRSKGWEPVYVLRDNEAPDEWANYDPDVPSTFPSEAGQTPITPSMSGEEPKGS